MSERELHRPASRGADDAPSPLDRVDEASAESMPASDSPGWGPLHAGAPLAIPEPPLELPDESPEPPQRAAPTHPCIRDDLMGAG